MAGQMRLDKYLGEMGMGTRSQLKEAAKKGRILVNGEVEKKTERKIVPGSDVVSFDGQPVSYVEMEYYMLNKPQGVVSATEDKRHQTVVELIGDRKRDDLFPVGRLDIDTEGLLLITTTGIWPTGCFPRSVMWTRCILHGSRGNSRRTRWSGWHGGSP